jgi:hypothetical protein
MQETSLESYRQLDVGTTRATLEGLYRDRYPDGYTDDELVQRTGMSLDTIRCTAGRFTIHANGNLEDSGERRLTRHGRLAIVWRWRELAAPPEPTAYLTLTLDEVNELYAVRWGFSRGLVRKLFKVRARLLVKHDRRAA